MITGSPVLPLPSFLTFYIRVRAHTTVSEPGTGWNRLEQADGLADFKSYKVDLSFPVRLLSVKT